MIELKNVSFSYENSSENSSPDEKEEQPGCLSNISLTIKDGETVLLTGASGCGKTTILRLINGLIPNFYEGKIEGEVLVNGSNVSNAELYETAKTVSTVFQNPRSQFFNVDTTSELAFPCENMGMPEDKIRERISCTVKRMNLDNLMNRSLFDLSGGQKQKIACASVDVSGNKIILLDEPSANLDTESILTLKELIKIWKNDGKTIVAAEHRLFYLWDLCDRTVILDKGQIKMELDSSQMKKMNDDDLSKFGLRSRNFVNPLDLVNIESESSDKNTVEKSDSNIILSDFYYCYKGSKKPVIDFSQMIIPKNKIIAVAGANGEGKTTFLQCICGLLKKSKGKMYFDGKWYNRRQRLKKIFMVMQDVNHQLFTETALDEVLISMENEDEGECKKILAELGLAGFENCHPMSLSGGQKQRLAIACAVASGREILLFDEPTSGLDFAHMKQICSLLRKLKKMGRSIIVVTHDSELIKNSCDYVVRLKNRQA